MRLHDRSTCWALLALVLLGGCPLKNDGESGGSSGRSGTQGATTLADGGVEPGVTGAGAGGSASGAVSGATGSDGGASEPPFVVPPAPDVAEPCDVSGCPPDLACASDGVCVTPPPECVDDGGCTGDARCGLTGECLAPGACRVTADCGMAELCAAGACIMGSDCGQTELAISPVAPNVLVLLDISGSMAQGLDGFTCIPIFTTCPPSKMTIASQAIKQMTITYRDRIQWGLARFPGDGGCGPPVNVIVPGPGQETLVGDTVVATVAAGSTPIYTALAHVQSAGYLNDPTRRNYLLFVSDGGESCDGDNAASAQIIADLRAQGIGTFVVGFGGGVDPAVLNDFAVAGGYPNTLGGTSYYVADSAAALESALGAILGQVVGCDFALAAPPADPDMVWAFFDNVMVDRDPTNGWSLDTAANEVTFVGTACDELKSGSVTDIDIVFGCPQPPLE